MVHVAQLSVMLLLQMILKFFDIFLKMKDLTTSEAFLVRFEKSQL